MRNLSFFFKDRGAGAIDGGQIGEFLSAKLNPVDGYEDDVCIYVKHQPPENFPRHSYLNVVDGTGLIPWLVDHPQMGVIATSVTAQKFLNAKLNRNVFLIPEHNCNYANEQRNRKEVKAVGLIGNQNGFNYDLEEAKKVFADMGLEFKWCCNYKDRKDVVDFYRTIDIQVNWRNHIHGEHAKLHNPLKLSNAGSFGIPTVSYPEENYVAEFDGCFVAVNIIEELFEKVRLLKHNPTIYEAYSKMALEKAQDYRIEKIATLYQNLSQRSYDPVI